MFRSSCVNFIIIFNISEFHRIICRNHSLLSLCYEDKLIFIDFRCQYIIFWYEIKLINGFSKNDCKM